MNRMEPMQRSTTVIRWRHNPAVLLLPCRSRSATLGEGSIIPIPGIRCKLRSNASTRRSAPGCRTRRPSLGQCQYSPEQVAATRTRLSASVHVGEGEGRAGLADPFLSRSSPATLRAGQSCPCRARAWPSSHHLCNSSCRKPLVAEKSLTPAPGTPQGKLNPASCPTQPFELKRRIVQLRIEDESAEIGSAGFTPPTLDL